MNKGRSKAPQRGEQMYITTMGLILRETIYKETSKILTVLTGAEGKLTVSARGARRKGSKTASATQLLCFSEMTLLESRGRWTLTEAQSIEQFTGLRDDLELLSLGTYFAELLEAVSDEDSPNPEILSLGLNALYALGELKKEPAIVKAAFEMGLMCLAGFMPSVTFCSVCSRHNIAEPVFDLVGGTVCCSGCKGFGDGTYIKMHPSALEAVRYIINSPSKKVFSFILGSAALKNLSELSERFTLTQLDRGFKTLDFYKSVGVMK